MNKDTNALNWFEIPVNDILRASGFYEALFGIKMIPLKMEGMDMSMFPADGSSGKVGGALVQSQMHQPSATGTIVYLNAQPDLQLLLNNIEKNGGKTILPKTKIDEHSGYMALFTDTEGNTIGLHSMQ